MGRWAPKTTFYDGYHELAYLHPSHFVPDPAVGEMLRDGNQRYFILRFARLAAHHDIGRSGITDDIARTLISRLKPHGRVLITAERPIAPEFERYRIRINPLDIHHALAFADLYVGDSQTMAAEAAVLGTRSVRFNDFVGKLSYLEELEHRYGLTIGVPTAEPGRLVDAIDKILSEPVGARSKRRERMLSECIDLAGFLTWYLEGYPGSARALTSNPDITLEFAGTTATRNDVVV